mmetsp:Transcript_11132/g.12596  ORF Transcript_11132/g.12596 Transcript_11132/m.12596 type:complete len:98 (-) Transcript_11132:268-561(-)
MKQSACFLPTAPCMKPRKVNLTDFASNTNIPGFENCFDFLKEANQEKKYKSTNQIPLLFSSDDLLNTESIPAAHEPEESKMPLRDEIYTPFFAIEED